MLLAEWSSCKVLQIMNMNASCNMRIRQGRWQTIQQRVLVENRVRGEFMNCLWVMLQIGVLLVTCSHQPVHIKQRQTQPSVTGPLWLKIVLQQCYTNELPNQWAGQKVQVQRVDPICDI